MFDWTAFILGAILTAIITLPIAIFGNLATPWVKKLYDKSVFTSRTNKFMKTLEYYWEIERLKKDSNRFVLDVLSNMLRLLFALLLILLMVVSIILVLNLEGFPIFSKEFYLSFFTAAISAFYFIAYGIMSSIKAKYKHVYNFEEYKMDVKERLIELGLKPERADEVLGSGDTDKQEE